MFFDYSKTIVKSASISEYEDWGNQMHCLVSRRVSCYVDDYEKFINNSYELWPISGQYLSHMCISVNPNTNQLGLMNYLLISYINFWYRLLRSYLMFINFWYRPLLLFHFTSTIKYSRLICMGVYNGEPKLRHCKRPYRSPAHILSTTCNFAPLQFTFHSFQLIILAKCVQTILELNWYEPFGDKKKKIKTCREALTSSIQVQNTSWKERKRLRNVQKRKTHVQSVQISLLNMQICEVLLREDHSCQAGESALLLFCTTSPTWSNREFKQTRRRRQREPYLKM